MLPGAEISPGRVENQAGTKTVTAMNKLTQIDAVAGISIWSVSGNPIDAKQPSFIYKSGAMINADGSPNCYGPNDSGIDFTANGGTPGKNWWGGPTDSKGMPLIQKIYEPSPGCTSARPPW